MHYLKLVICLLLSPRALDGTSRHSRAPSPLQRAKRDSEKMSFLNSDDPDQRSSQNSVESRRLDAKKIEIMKRYLISQDNQFEGKHLYRSKNNVKVVNGNPLNSFSEFSTDPSYAKQYLVELNRKVYQSGILPGARGNEMTLWFENMGNAKLTILDTDIDVLKTDISKKFKEWKAGSALPDGKLIPGTRLPNIMTENAYRATHLTFEMDDQGNVKVMAEQIRTRVELGTDENGKPSHFERINSAESESISAGGKIEIANFTRHELETNAKVTQKFWKDLGMCANAKNVILNENDATYKSFNDMANEDFTMQTRDCCGDDSVKKKKDEDSSQLPGTCKPGGTCAILLSANGDVESISPKLFNEEFKRANDTEKSKMAELVRKNKDKIVKNLGEDVDDQKMNKLIELERAKAHVNALDAVSQVEHVRKENDGGPHTTPNSTQNVVKELETTLSRVEGKIRLSATNIAHGLSKVAGASQGAQRSSEGVSTRLSKQFLSKTVMNGIMQGDTTSLAIVGARVGYNNIEKSGAVKADAKDFSVASKVGKAAKGLGALAGPIGDVLDSIDISLNVYLLTKSVERLKNAKNKYDRDDAIADIVSDSVNLAVTATVTVLSKIAPPLAPLLKMIGTAIELLTKIAVKLFKAFNAVARINSQVPLLGFEKDYVFRSRFFDWFGLRKPDYIDNLVKEKAANDMAVQKNLAFLERNQQILGIVFPSRTLSFDGGCKLTKRYCKLANAWGCTKWSSSPRYTIGSECSRNRPCGSTNRICVDDYEYISDKVGRWDYDDYKCECSGETTTFGHPRSDSFVDLKKYHTIYWERSVPADVSNANFLCKPGNSKYIDYKVSQQNSRTGYYCRNAIGLLQPEYRRYSGQSMLYDLEDGSDTVYALENTPSIFKMGNDGRKEFWGAGDRDEFLFDSDCSKSLSGFVDGKGGEEDTITIGENCARGKEIKVDFEDDYSKLTTNQHLNIRLYDIEQFNGRQGQREVVKIGCNTRKVLGRGGVDYSQMDHVYIRNIEYPPCQYNVTIYGAAYTKITSTAKRGIITVPIDNPWNGMDVELLVRPNHLKLTVIFLKTSSSQVTKCSVESPGGQQLKLELAAFSNSQRIQFTFNFDSDASAAEKHVSIYFTEQPSGSNSILFISDGGRATVFYHSLPPVSSSSSWRTGCKYVENVFDVSGSNWYVTGGDKADEFILGTKTVGMIDGGSGVDTLKFSQNYRDGRMFVDLTSSTFTRLENVYGLAGVPISVATSCEALLIATQGGSPTESDSITIPRQHCTRRNLQILAVGHVQMIWKGGRREASQSDVVKVLVNGNDGASDLKFELNVESVEMANLLVVVMLSHRNWKMVEAKRNTAQQSVFVHLSGYSSAGRNEWIKFNQKENVLNGGDDGSPYLPSPLIQIQVGNSDDNEVHGTLMFDRETLEPKIMFTVTGYETSGYTFATGMEELENVFRLTASGRDWRVTGGRRNDLFVISTTATTTGGRYSLSGNGGDDTLIIENASESNSDPTFVINLQKQEIGYYQTTPESRGKILHIHRVFGRPKAPDVIHPDCSTKTINGRGGRGPNHEQDIIQINFPRCNALLEIEVEVFTTVRSTTSWGRFTYNVGELLTNTLELMPTNENRHLINFSFHPWQVITAVSFNESAQAMGWIVAGNNGEHERVQVFPLSRPSHSSNDDYNNPVFEFQPPGSSVSSDIRVGADGVTMATFMVMGNTNPDVVRGLPVDVNRFLINITNTAAAAASARGIIQGCSDGLRCSANQFWIFNLQSHLEVLDGGACRQRESDCVNYLHFSESATTAHQGQIHVDMDIAHGSVRTNSGVALISHLRNIHELHGTRGIVAYVTCDISQVSKVDKVVVKASSGENCPMNLIIGLEEYTKVWFQRAEFLLDPKLNEVDNDDDEKEIDDDDGISESAIHYRFARPMTFELEGDYAAILSHNHNIFLPFKLSQLVLLHFDLEQDRLNYSISENEFYFISMISAPGYNEQFYSQPNIVTEDGFKIQVARDGSLWTFLGNSSASLEVSIESVPELQNLANLLGVTMVLEKTPVNQFYFIGHNGSTGQDRNVLQNIASSESHLGGGGSNDTIYEISHLNKDVYIHTGYTNSKEFVDKQSIPSKNSNAAAAAKQTIDLTDVVVPIRQMTATKYVPKVSLDKENLVISMEGHENVYPGKVVIVSGSSSRVAKGVQLLLNNALMDLVPSEEENYPEILNEENASTGREKRSLNDNNVQWNIRPRPVVIPQDITIFSMSPEDLEDGQNIQFEEIPESKNDNETATSSSTREGENFNAVKKGSDLYLTNIINQVGSGELKTVIISDFYHQPPTPSPQSDFKTNTTSQDNSLELNATATNEDDEGRQEKNDMPTAGILGVTIHLPGLDLMLNESEVLDMSVEVQADGDDDNSTEAESKSDGRKRTNDEFVQVISFEKVMYKVEDVLLQDMPDVERTFWSETLAAEDVKDTYLPDAWIHILLGFLLFVAVSIGLVTSCLVWHSARLQNRKGSFQRTNGGTLMKKDKLIHAAGNIESVIDNDERVQLVCIKSFDVPKPERALLVEINGKESN